MRQGGLRRVERAPEIDVDDAGEILRTHVAHQLAIGDAGIRDDHVDTPEAFAHAFEGAAHGDAIGDVSFKSNGAVAEGLGVLSQQLALKADESDRVALLSESSGNTCA
jgi:hypothetical protein